MKQALITGIAGFAGSHLATQLLDEGCSVAGIVMPGESLRRIERLRSSLDLRFADISDSKALRVAVAGSNPDCVFHLAAVASVPAALSAPETAFRVNTLGTANLLEALRANPPRRFIYISSADVYGRVPEASLPIRETQCVKPASAYASSKAASEVIVAQYWRTYAMPVVILRPFNHTGPGQGPGFAPSDFASAIAKIEKQQVPPLLAVGNLESYRDFSDVRDMARAYALAAKLCEPGETYNIASGAAVKVGDVLRMLLSLSKASIEVAQDPVRQRPSDTPIVTGDRSKFSRRTGWAPSISLETTLRDLLDSWRSQV